MITVTVPATSANMGPGFDSIGIALNLYNRFYMEESDQIDISATNGEDIPKDETNLVYQCAKRVYDICGKPMHGLKLVEECSIPQTRGLGSSSACTVAGLIGANALLGNPLHQENIIDLAAAIEGHPDNSTPAILGGFCTALLEYGKVWSVRVPIADKVDFVAFIPNFELATERARQAIPQTVPHKDAVFNLSRAALLTGSLVTGDLHNLMVAAGDCLHQPYRFGLIPNGEEVVRSAKGLGALGAFLSGAGPTIIAMVDKEDKTYYSRACMYFADRFPDWTPVLLACDEVGATVEPTQSV
ncbi:MAG: homoserine kinase [Eubacteriales bacterium]|nr:homoserine kinase [Eubacteriales bacterium]